MRIHELAAKWYKQGGLTFAESAAIIGAVELICEQLDNKTPLAEQFTTEYGTFAEEAIHELTKESE